jgi:DNA polymerase-3 subunit delta'
VLEDQHADVHILPDKIVVADVDSMLQGILVQPFGNTKIYIIDAMHTANVQAQNKLLKCIEEPPPSVVFIIGALTLAQVLPTITSRCRTIEVQPFGAVACKTSFLRYYKDDARLQRALWLGQGRLQAIHALLDGTDIDLALRVALELKNSADLPRLSKALQEDKQNLLQIVHDLQLIYRDVLVHISRSALAVSVTSFDLVALASMYTKTALVNILALLPRTAARIATHGNTASIVDEMLFMLLEQRYNYRAVRP